MRLFRILITVTAGNMLLQTHWGNCANRQKRVTLADDFQLNLFIFFYHVCKALQSVCFRIYTTYTKNELDP